MIKEKEYSSKMTSKLRLSKKATIFVILLCILVLGAAILVRMSGFGEMVPAGLSLDTANANLSGNVAVGNDQTASGGKYIVFGGDNISLTPPMGWNHYNHFEHRVNEALIRSVADAMVVNGMRDAGYRYVNLDDTWEADNAHDRDANGNIPVNTTLFPSGMKSLGDYIHSKGLLFGLYTSPGERTCDTTFHLGSAGHVTQDVATFASWGVDFLKLDWCGEADYSPQGAAEIVQQWQDAIKASGRPMVLSINAGAQGVGDWAKNYSPVMWRTGDDICSSWFNKTQAHDGAAKDCYNSQYHSGIYDYINSNVQDNAPSVGPGHWADADMLEVGNPGLSFDEAKTHFSLWALWSAPLIAGNDPRQMNGTDDASKILLNKEVIAIDQDPAVKMGTKVQDNNGLQIWSKQLQATGQKAVLLLNTTGNTTNMTVSWDTLGFSQVSAIRDLWAHQDLSVTGNSFSANVPSHGVVMLKVTGQ